MVSCMDKQFFPDLDAMFMCPMCDRVATDPVIISLTGGEGDGCKHLFCRMCAHEDERKVGGKCPVDGFVLLDGDELRVPDQETMVKYWKLEAVCEVAGTKLKVPLNRWIQH